MYSSNTYDMFVPNSIPGIVNCWGESCEQSVSDSFRGLKPPTTEGCSPSLVFYTSFVKISWLESL